MANSNPLYENSRTRVRTRSSEPVADSPKVANIFESLESGDLDAQLNALGAAIDKRKHKFFREYQIGDHLFFPRDGGVRPKYLLGAEVIVKAKRKTRFEVQIVHPELLPKGVKLNKSFTCPPGALRRRP